MTVAQYHPLPFWGRRLDNGAPEQVFDHIKDEFFRGRTWPDFESFRADLDAYVGPLEHPKASGQIEGIDPGGAPESIPCGVVFI